MESSVFPVKHQGDKVKSKLMTADDTISVYLMQTVQLNCFRHTDTVTVCPLWKCFLSSPAVHTLEQTCHSRTEDKSISVPHIWTVLDMVTTDVESITYPPFTHLCSVIPAWFHTWQFLNPVSEVILRLRYLCVFSASENQEPFMMGHPGMLYSVAMNHCE